MPGDNNKLTYQSIVIRASETNERPEAIRKSRMHSQAVMSRMSAAVAQHLATKEMSYVMYLVCSIGFYALIVFLAMVLKDISSIFDFVSAYSISSLAFFIPAFFYRSAVKKFNVPMTREVQNRLRTACILIPIGCLNAVLGITSAIIVVAGLE